MVEGYAIGAAGAGGGAAAVAASSDDQLMAALGRGDAAGLAELVRRHEAPLTGYLAGIVRDAERARDLAQETFLRIVRSAARYRPTARFSTWLYHIARNVARDELRTRRRRPRLHGAEEQALDATPAQQVDHARALADREVVVRALAALSARDRDLLLLRDAEGRSYEEIAERTGLALGTVKSGLNRARARFAAQVGALA